jgi:hypothetical protein
MKALVLLALAATVGTGFLPRQVEVRIEGYLGGTREQVRPWQMLWVRIAEDELEPFAMTNLITLTATGPSAAEIVEQVQPIKPNFIFQGSKEQLEEIRTALPNQLLKITGYTRFGSQWVLVNRVERSEPITGPTPTPSWREKFLGF